MRRWAYLFALVLVGVAVTGIAVAASRSGEVRAVSGDIEAALVGTPVIEQCGAPEDNTERVRATFEGTVSSPDAALSGDVKARTTLVIDNDTGDGTVRAHVIVRDPASGEPKVVGKFLGATTGLTDFRFQGLLHARIVPGGGELVANVTLTQNEDLSLTGEFGKDDPVPPSNKAVVSTACLDEDSHEDSDEDSDDD
jgi:hypothetical protein